MSTNKEKGIKYLLDLNIYQYLDLPNLKEINPCDDLIGIWTQANVDNIYPFTKSERVEMNKIRELLKLDLTDKYNIYKYGLYTSTVAYKIKNIDISKLSALYQELPITSRKEINITGEQISRILKRPPGSYINDILLELEKEIITNNLENKTEKLTEYILNNSTKFY